MKTLITRFLLVWIFLSKGLVHAQSTEIRPGVILPQMTTAQRNALSATNGMLVFDTNTQSYWLRSNNVWTELPKTAANTNFWEQSGAVGNEIKNTNSGGFWSANPTLANPIHSAVVPVSGLGTRLMWISSQSAFRAGTVERSQWNADNIGFASIAMGYNTTASANYSTAMGVSTTASGSNSIAMGNYRTASGGVSTAMGVGTLASGDYSTSMGYETIASGSNSTAMGWYNEDDPNGLLMLGNGNSTRKTILVVRKDNSMGLGDFGAATNTLATLHVNTSKNTSTGSATVLYPTTATLSNFPTASAALSIYASQGIFSGTYVGSAQNVVLSDARIKEISGISDNAHDLATLRRLCITDYRMKDSYVWGDRKFKKVIAQQVEEVYPQAVTYQKSFIPDIYQIASLENGFIRLPHHTLKKGERVKLIIDNREEITEVLATTLEGFKIADSTSQKNVFVYGREVSDFRSVDYEALSMLGISAIQQLAKENETLKDRLSRLETLVENLATAEATAKTGN